MTTTSYENALDGAEKVVAHTYDDHLTILIAWHGGTTFNCYEIRQQGIEEFDVFNVSDDKGRPVDKETAEQHMRERLDDIVSPDD